MWVRCRASSRRARSYDNPLKGMPGGSKTRMNPVEHRYAARPEGAVVGCQDCCLQRDVLTLNQAPFLPQQGRGV